MREALWRPNCYRGPCFFILTSGHSMAGQLVLFGDQEQSSPTNNSKRLALQAMLVI